MTRIAICYWGLTRSTRYVYQSHHDKLFNVLKDQNIDFDVFIHTWKIDDTTMSVKNDYEEHKFLNPYKYEIDNEEEFLKSITFSDYFYEDLYKKYGDNHLVGEWPPHLVRNHLCSLESKKRVTAMVKTSGNAYTYIMYIRPDVDIKTAFPVECLQKINEMDAVIPNFDHFIGYNDRFAVFRFQDCDKYANRLDEIIEFRKHNGRIAGEKYVKFILVKYYKNVHQINFRFDIVRPR